MSLSSLGLKTSFHNFKHSFILYAGGDKLSIQSVFMELLSCFTEMWFKVGDNVVDWYNWWAHHAFLNYVCIPFEYFSFPSFTSRCYDYYYFGMEFDSYHYKIECMSKNIFNSRLTVVKNTILSDMGSGKQAV